ncbi:MAG: YidC/Oxa1 family membrane protein insertase [Eubacteriales bacterium]|nr:YidC/Oxa1 family membrane protein insertase [Eubacteriales bacterium]
MDFITNFFVGAMDWVAGLVGSYGWTVVIVTIILRLILSPLDYKTRKDTRRQQKMMALMRPELDVIEKKYKDNPTKLNKKRQEIYEKYKFNPMSMMSGCILPMILQFGLLILFFDAFRSLMYRESFKMIELLSAGQPFETEGWLWVRNVWQPDTTSASIIPNMNSMYTAIQNAFQKNSSWASDYITTFKDAYGDNAVREFALAYEALYTNATGAVGSVFPSGPNGYYILPILAGATTLLNAYINPTQPQGGAEASGTGKMDSGKIMTWMFAGIAVFFCLNNNAAFGIYWLTSNLVATGNSFVINRILDKKEKQAAAAAPGDAKGSITK